MKQNDPKVKASVIMSAKESDFIAGADINMFTACKVCVHRPAGLIVQSSEDMEKISTTAQKMFDLMAR